ncbi:hypothetical protein G6F68_017423 [Rhizopus microsporus]|nr:hypothetical protein G6F68_017423 [Rhizopus microsporus]
MQRQEQPRVERIEFFRWPELFARQQQAAGCRCLGVQQGAGKVPHERLERDAGCVGRGSRGLPQIKAVDDARGHLFQHGGVHAFLAAEVGKPGPAKPVPGVAGARVERVQILRQCRHFQAFAPC